MNPLGNPLPDEPRSSPAAVPRLVLAAAAAALAVRVLWVLSTATGHIVFEKYFFLGRKLAERGWVPGIALTSSPLYTYVVGFLHAVLGLGETGVRLVQAVVAAAAVLAAGLAARRLAGPRAAALAAFILALYPSLVLYDTEPLPVVWENLCNALCLWLLLRSQDSGSRRETALAGLCLGLSATLRPNILLWSAALVPWLLLRDRAAGGEGAASRRPLARAGLFLAAAACAILPVTWVNSRADGGLVLVTASGGSTLFGGNNRDTDGLYFQPPAGNMELQLTTPDSAIRDVITAEHLGFRTLAERIAGRTLSAREASAFWRAETLAWARREPGRSLRLLAAKARLFFNAYEQHDISSAYTRGLPLRRLQTAAFVLVWPLGLLGLGLSLASWRRWLPVPGLFAVFFSTTVIFYVNARLRAPAVLPLALAAGLAVERLAAWARLRRTGALAASGALLLAAAGIGLHAGREVRANESRSRAFFAHFQRGTDAALAGSAAAATNEFAAALALNPTIAVDVLSFLDGLPASPAWEPARRAATEAMGRGSGDADPAAREAARLVRDGYALVITRRYQEAVDLFGRAAAADPGSPEPVFGRANALTFLGRWREALADYERAFDLGRKFGTRLDEAYLVMGRVALNAGEAGKARDYLARALFVNPNLDEARRLLSRIGPG